MTKLAKILRPDTQHNYDWWEAMAHDNSTYDREIKLDFIAQYLLLGSIKEAAEEVGINYRTAQNWKNVSSWWPYAEAHVKNSLDFQLEARLSRIADTVLEKLESRVDEGDVVFTREGEKKVPVKADSLARILNSILTQKRETRKAQEETQHGKLSGDTEKKVQQMLDKFAEVAQFRKADTIEGELLDYSQKEGSGS